MGKYSEAEKNYNSAKTIYEKVVGKEHLDYSNTLNNLGYLYYKVDNYFESEKYYLEAKTIQEKILGKEHPSYATSLNNLASLYVKLAIIPKQKNTIWNQKQYVKKFSAKNTPLMLHL